jgi:hypothetical protein
MGTALESAFIAANVVASVGWFVLIVRPGWEKGTRLVAPIVVPGVLALGYLLAMAVGLPGAEGGFTSLEGVSRLLARPVVLLGGWIHYLAFDLVVGAWELRDSRAIGLPHAAVVVCLLLTFVLGPAGFLAYLVLRAAARKRVEV